MATGDKQTPEESFQEFKDKFNINIFQEVQKSIDEMVDGANELNKVFGGINTRMMELQNTVADATKGILSMGGSLEDVNKTLQSIADGTRRNIAASAEDSRKLFASQQVLNQTVETLVNKFADIGVQFPMIGEQLEKSVNYVQNLGLNVRGVMGDVTKNMDQMNRFQFEGGVVGLTKMAAQASMLRFDMNETFKLADAVLKPEGAIQTAAAFQRLGVAAGDLVDPFQLMNQSINDPSGLQNSLVNVSKQFTYFDEKSKSFKINPQGVLTLKEMAEELHMNFNELSKMGLSAAELDKKLTSIRPDIKFEDEEDKKLLANIATMDAKTGAYQVSISDRDGNVQQVKLTELTQDQTKQVIDQLKTGPKSMEDIARSQMTITQKILTSVDAIKAGFSMGFASMDQTKAFVGSVNEIAGSFTNSLLKITPETPEVRSKMTSLASEVQTLVTHLLKGGDKTEINKEIDRLGKEFKGYDTSVDNLLNKFTTDIKEKMSNTQYNLTDKVAEYFGVKGGGKEIQKSLNKHTVDITGKVDIDFMSTSNVFAGLSKSQIQELFKSKEIQEMITKIVHDKWPEMYTSKQ